MPTIEMHGLAAQDVPTMRLSIKKALRRAPYAPQVVTVDCKDDVRDLDGESRPFLRIKAEKETLDRLERYIKMRLSHLRIDLEFEDIRSFTAGTS